MKKLFIVLLGLSLIVPLVAADNKPIQFNLGNWLWKPAAAVSLTNYVTKDGLTPMTANWAMGAFTLSQATWQGVAVAPTYGGIGALTPFVIGDLLYASTTTALSKLADVAVGQVLVSGGVGAAPAWSGNPSVASLVLTGTGTLASTAGNASFTTSLTAASGNEVAFTLTGTVNKAGGDDTILKVVQTDTASPGTSYLQEWYTGTTQKAYIDNTGLLQLDGGQTVSGTSTLGSISIYSSTISWGTNGNLSFGGSNYTTVSGGEDVITIGGGTHSNSSGSNSVLVLAPVYNQTSTAGAIDFKVNRTETAIGSGTQRLFSGQVGSVEKWGVDNRGGMMVGLTPDAVLQVGMVAMADAGTDERYDVNGAGGTLPIGVVGGSGPTVAGTARGLAVQGTCYVAPAEDVVACTRGHVCFVDASDAGYVDDNAALQAAGLNIGIYITSEAAVAFNGADDVAADGTITLDSDPTGWAVGDPVIYWDSGDTAPAELTTGGVYWIQAKTGADVKLAATRGGAAITLTDGSGTTMYLMRLPKVLLNWR